MAYITYQENGYFFDDPQLRQVSTWKEIYLKRFFHNLDTLIRWCDHKNLSFLVPVKANAYGHGMIGIAKAVEDYGRLHPDYTGGFWFGVANVMEGVTLRKYGISIPVLVLGPLQEQLLSYYKNFNLIPTLATLVDLANWLEWPGASHLSFHIKFDTGMGRLGIPVAEQDHVFALLASHNVSKVNGIYSHLATSDEPGDQNTLNQIEKFDQIKKRFIDSGIAVEIFHLANSGGLINFSQIYYDMVRPGIALYGYYPSEASREMMERNDSALQPVMEVKSRVTATKTLPENHGISYGRMFITDKPTRIALIGIGYGDGFPRELSNQWSVRFHGKNYPILGRVSMDQIVIARDDEGPSRGEEVVILGDGLWANDLAEKMRTISYEILCQFSARVPILYRSEDNQ